MGGHEQTCKKTVGRRGRLLVDPDIPKISKPIPSPAPAEKPVKNCTKPVQNRSEATTGPSGHFGTDLNEAQKPSQTPSLHNKKTCKKTVPEDQYKTCKQLVKNCSKSP